MRRGERFPEDQAEIVFCDPFIEYLDKLTESDRIDVIAEMVVLCQNPGGKHPLSNRGGFDNLSGLNTVEVINGQHRVVFSSREVEGVGLIEVLCAGPRKENVVYTIASALISSGHLDQQEANQIWQALELLEVVAESVGLDGWDYAPPPAPEGMRKAVVAAGLLNRAVADLLSKDEINAAQSDGWSNDGADPAAALAAALKRARSSAGGLEKLTFEHRAAPRCGATMPRASARCIRKVGHPGAHRSAP